MDQQDIDRRNKRAQHWKSALSTVLVNARGEGFYLTVNSARTGEGLQQFVSCSDERDNHRSC